MPKRKVTKEDLTLRALAEIELRKRREESYEKYKGARESLLGFARHVNPLYVVDPFHQLLAKELEDVLWGKTKRLIITAAPQHGKSQMASIYFPAFWLGHRPNNDMILASYNDDLASDKSKQVRAVLNTEEYRQLFPSHALRLDTRASGMWRLAPPNRGAMKVAGVGGGITGFGAELGLIDDPFKDWADSQSPLVRDQTWRWYLGVFRTRIRQDGAIVIIMTRWHEDDLVGRLLQQGDWKMIRLPALAESDEERQANQKYLGLPDEGDALGRAPGEAASPSRFSIATLEAIKKDVGPMVWAAEYQGVPRPMEGNRIKRDWLKVVDRVPSEFKSLVRFWDKASTAYDMGKKHGAATAGILMAVDSAGFFYVLDAKQAWLSAMERENLIRKTADEDVETYGYVKIWLEQEPGSGGKDSVDATIRSLAGYAVFAEKPTGSKDERLEPLAAQLEAGHVSLLRGSWNTAFIDEMCAVPNGLRRDQADAAAGAFNKLAAITLAAKRVPFTGLFAELQRKDRPAFGG